MVHPIIIGGCDGAVVATTGGDGATGGVVASWPQEGRRPRAEDARQEKCRETAADGRVHGVFMAFSFGRGMVSPFP